MSCGCNKQKSSCCAPAPGCEKVKALQVTTKLISNCSTDLLGETRVNTLKFGCPAVCGSECSCGCSSSKSKQKQWQVADSCDQDNLLLFQRVSACGKAKSVAALTPAGVLLQSVENKTAAVLSAVIDPSVCTRYTFIRFASVINDATGTLLDGAYDGQEKTVAISGPAGIQYSLRVAQGVLAALLIVLDSTTPSASFVWSEAAGYWIPL